LTASELDQRRGAPCERGTRVKAQLHKPDGSCRPVRFVRCRPSNFALPQALYPLRPKSPSGARPSFGPWSCRMGPIRPAPNLYFRLPSRADSDGAPSVRPILRPPTPCTISLSELRAIWDNMRRTASATQSWPRYRQSPMPESTLGPAIASHAGLLGYGTNRHRRRASSLRQVQVWRRRSPAR